MTATHLFAGILLKSWTLKDYHYYLKHIRTARHIQDKILNNILIRNRNTLFGREHYFSRIHNLSDYQKNVPIRNYEDFIPYIDKISHGESQILTKDAVRLFEPTGGSTGGSKLIPYTSSLKAEFMRGINIWLYDIFRQYPAVLRGRSYWSVSPVKQRSQKTPGGIPVGFDSDTDYLGPLAKIVASAFAVPEIVKKVKSIENFRQISAFFLLSAHDLSLISVWNPTFLTLILDHILKFAESLLKSIFDGIIYIQDNENISYLKPYLRKSEARAKQLEQLFSLSEKEIFKNIWPGLKLISCWKDGSAAALVKPLETFFPDAIIQGKGLLATEGFITLPFSAAGGCLPAYTSHFLEFLSTSDGSVHTIADMEMGELYSVVVSTGGGLYRYNLGDLVRVTGWHQRLPLLTFEGRLQTSDLVGEKLQENFIQNVITQAKGQCHIDLRFLLFAPVILQSQRGYCLFLDTSVKTQIKKLKAFGYFVEQRLNSNFHYKYARELNQLSPLRIFLITGNALNIYEKRCIDEGQKAGDIKLSCLDRRTGWESYFEGHFIK